MYEAREEMHEEVQQSADEEEEPTEQPIPEPSKTSLKLSSSQCARLMIQLKVELNLQLMVSIQNSARLTEIASSLKEINFPSLQTRITNVENTHVTMQFGIYSIWRWWNEMFRDFARDSFFLTIQAHIEKEERMERATQEVKLNALSKPELIKVVEEVATEAEVDPKVLRSSKGGQEFLKKIYAELSDFKEKT
ncbi:hypothetical protein Tco_0179309 [Tanacetum coccineum]